MARVAYGSHPLIQTETAEHDSVVAVYEGQAATEAAILALASTGFDLRMLSVVGKGYSMEEGVVGLCHTGDRIKAWGKTGAFWDGLWGMLFGSALFVMPGVGPLFAAGPLVTWIAGALEGSTVGSGQSAFGAGLYSVGIPTDSVLNYETQIKAGKFLVIAHGDRSQVEESKTILSGAACHHGTSACCG